jgi:uncharacterized protein
MKLTLIITCLFCSISLFAQDKKENTAPRMRQYWFVMLMKGPERSQDSVTAAKLQEGHMNNINKMHVDGKLKVAGPFGDDGNWRGIFILDCETKEEAVKLLAQDPAIAAGRLIYEIHPWYTEPSGSFLPGKPKP